MKKVLLLGALALLLALLVGLGFITDSRKSGEGLVELHVSVLGNSYKELYNASGVSIEELLEVRHNITYSGRLKCLDGVCDTGKFYWKLYTNNASSNQGVRGFKVRPGDVILLQYD